MRTKKKKKNTVKNQKLMNEKAKTAEEKQSRIVKNREIRTTRVLPSVSALICAALFITRMSVSPQKVRLKGKTHTTRWRSSSWLTSSGLLGSLDAPCSHWFVLSGFRKLAAALPTAGCPGCCIGVVQLVAQMHHPLPNSSAVSFFQMAAQSWFWYGIYMQEQQLQPQTAGETSVQQPDLLKSDEAQMARCCLHQKQYHWSWSKVWERNRETV